MSANHGSGYEQLNDDPTKDVHELLKTFHFLGRQLEGQAGSI